MPGSELGAFAPGLPDPGALQLVVGMSSLFMNPNFVLSFGMNWRSPETVENDFTQLNNSTFDFGVAAGYPLIYREKHKVYPLLGVSWVIDYLHISDKNDLNL
ncbi:MAG TPA: hypothetical protein DCG19_05255 [Cryomorphaceae bacterium]|nr:hypothetical protein [Owenweeksia sp.]MBF98893.1 hypothetical protein [Owenweeksia sp.]HAD96792.1 hypothetical protein [Cryomorphaceae bacterium]HBF21347.1 hypothetical protein [Cryomorphaceae bacterium]HCQ14793.1 hypothetical protein [Cryomorphaceae bacterium]|tara:strand:- start:3 stop:308 length:306 start_codon:yes stop_codon:yes gene_type:complete